MLNNKLALVTGASSGIGQAVAAVLAERAIGGICLTGRNGGALDELAECLRRKNTGLKVWVSPADLARTEDVRGLAETVATELRGLDILIHSAGIIVNNALSCARVEDFDDQYRVNVRAPFLLTQLLLPLLRQNHGQIVFVNSSAGLRATPGAGQYAATKHALRAVADTFRNEVNGDGVRVLSVYPGRTATPMQAALQKAEGTSYRPEFLIQPLDVASLIVNSLEMPRSVEVTDLKIRPMTKSV